MRTSQYHVISLYLGQSLSEKRGKLSVTFMHATLKFSAIQHSGDLLEIKGKDYLMQAGHKDSVVLIKYDTRSS